MGIRVTAEILTPGALALEGTRLRDSRLVVVDTQGETFAAGEVLVASSDIIEGKPVIVVGAERFRVRADPPPESLPPNTPLLLRVISSSTSDTSFEVLTATPDALDAALTTLGEDLIAPLRMMPVGDLPRGTDLLKAYFPGLANALIHGQADAYAKLYYQLSVNQPPPLPQLTPPIALFEELLNAKSPTDLQAFVTTHAASIPEAELRTFLDTQFEQNPLKGLRLLVDRVKHLYGREPEREITERLIRTLAALKRDELSATLKEFVRELPPPVTRAFEQLTQAVTTNDRAQIARVSESLTHILEGLPAQTLRDTATAFSKLQPLTHPQEIRLALKDLIRSVAVLEENRASKLLEELARQLPPAVKISFERFAEHAVKSNPAEAMHAAKEFADKIEKQPPAVQAAVIDLIRSFKQITAREWPGAASLERDIERAITVASQTNDSVRLREMFAKAGLLDRQQSLNPENVITLDLSQLTTTRPRSSTLDTLREVARVAARISSLDPEPLKQMARFLADSALTFEHETLRAEILNVAALLEKRSFSETKTILQAPVRIKEEISLDESSAKLRQTLDRITLHARSEVVPAILDSLKKLGATLGQETSGSEAQAKIDLLRTLGVFEKELALVSSPPLLKALVAELARSLDHPAAMALRQTVNDLIKTESPRLGIESPQGAESASQPVREPGPARLTIEQILSNHSAKDAASVARPDQFLPRSLERLKALLGSSEVLSSDLTSPASPRPDIANELLRTIATNETILRAPALLRSAEQEETRQVIQNIARQIARIPDADPKLRETLERLVFKLERSTPGVDFISESLESITQWKQQTDRRFIPEVERLLPVLEQNLSVELVTEPSDGLQLTHPAAQELRVLLATARKALELDIERERLFTNVIKELKHISAHAPSDDKELLDSLKQLQGKLLDLDFDIPSSRELAKTFLEFLDESKHQSAESILEQLKKVIPPEKNLSQPFEPVRSLIRSFADELKQFGRNTPQESLVEFVRSHAEQVARPLSEPEPDQPTARPLDGQIRFAREQIEGALQALSPGPAVHSITRSLEDSPPNHVSRSREILTFVREVESKLDHLTGEAEIPELARETLEKFTRTFGESITSTTTPRGEKTLLRTIETQRRQLVDEPILLDSRSGPRPNRSFESTSPLHGPLAGKEVHDAQKRNRPEVRFDALESAPKSSTLGEGAQHTTPLAPTSVDRIERIADRAMSALRGYENIVRGQEMLSQLNPLLQSLGEPAFFLFPLFFHGVFTQVETTFYGDEKKLKPKKRKAGSADEKESRGDAQEKQRKRQHIRFALNLSALGQVEVDCMHTFDEIFLNIVSEHAGVVELVNENIEELRRPFAELGYVKFNARVTLDTPSSVRPSWVRAITNPDPI